VVAAPRLEQPGERDVLVKTRSVERIVLRGTRVVPLELHWPFFCFFTSVLDGDERLDRECGRIWLQLLVS
jgi:hypothetical protein